MWSQIEAAFLIVLCCEALLVMSAFCYSRDRILNLIIVLSCLFSIAYSLITRHIEILFYSPWFEGSIVMFIAAKVVFAFAALVQKGIFYRFITFTQCASGMGVTLAMLQNHELAVWVYWIKRWN